MRHWMTAATAAICLTSLPALAQQAPTGAAVTASTPGSVTAAATVRASVVVTAIDKASRTVTLKDEKGALFDLAVGTEVRNFEQIKVGDEVIVEYARALSLELKKRGEAKASDKGGVVRSEKGARPGGAVAREITIVADVVDVNPTARTISLKGPKGNVVVLDVKNPDHFKVVKKGDQVEVTYTEALAIAVEPAQKKKK